MAAEDSVALELFIKKVREYPVLYDQDHGDYSDKRIRENVWKEIGDYFHSPASLVQKKWQILRGSFRRTHRYVMECQRIEENRPCKRRRIWKYYHQMAFILPKEEDRDPSDDSYSIYPDEPDLDTIKSPIEAEFLDLGSTSVDSSALPSNYGTAWNQLKLETTHDIEINADEEEEEEDPEPEVEIEREEDFEEERRRDSDGLQKFFESMYETVRNFPAQYQRRAKRAVFDAVCNVENEMEIV